MIPKLLLTALVTLGMVALACSSDEAPEPAPTQAPQSSQTTQASSQSGPKQWSSAPAVMIDQGKKYTAVFELAKGEEFEIELFADKAPKTVNNFVFLAREGYYDGVTFHRVLGGIHGTERRPHRHRHRRSRIPIRGRIPSQPKARRSGHPVHGQRRTQYERQPVLHNFRADTQPQRQALGVRQGLERDGRGEQPHSPQAVGGDVSGRRNRHDPDSRGVAAGPDYYSSGFFGWCVKVYSRPAAPIQVLSNTGLESVTG